MCVVCCTRVFLQGHAPSPEPGVERNALEAAQDLWTNLTRTDQNMEFTVQASSIASCGKERKKKNKEKCICAL